MHVMDEGSDALVYSDAKIVSLKSVPSSSSTSSTMTAAKPHPEEPIVSSKVSSVKDESIKSKELAHPVAIEVSKNSSVEAVKDKKDDENKENKAITDGNTKDLPKKPEDEAVKADIKPLDDQEKKDREDAEIMDQVMDEIDDIIEDTEDKENESKENLDDELTFQMDADGSQPDDTEEDDDDEDDEDEDEDDEDNDENAVDLSSSYDASKSDREDSIRHSQTDESDAIEMLDSSPEKSRSIPETPKQSKKLEAPALDIGDRSPKIRIEQAVSIKQEVEDDADKHAADTPVKSSPSKQQKQSEKKSDVPTVTRKRRRSIDPDDNPEEHEPLIPSKKLKRELECNFQMHDLLLREYIETTSNNTMDDVQKHTEELLVDIQTLNEMIRAKEVEWNNMIHLKKVKEEILTRLTRKKHVMGIVGTKLGEEEAYLQLDSSNHTNVRSASVGPRPPTPPPEVDIRPASVNPMHSNNKSQPVSVNNSISSRIKENSLLAQFNSSITMVPLSTSPSLITSANTILAARANMKPAEIAKEKPNAAQIQRQILPKPVLSNHQQIMNNLAMSAGLSAVSTSGNATSISNTTSTVTAAAAALAANNILAGLSAAGLLNGHHNPGGSHGNQLQVGRQGVIKDVKSIIADYRQKHPEQVPRRGRRLKNLPNFDGVSISSKGALGFLLGQETSRPSSNDSSQSNSNNNTTPNNFPAQGLPNPPGGLSFKDVLVQFAKMSQSDHNLLSNLTNAAASAAAAAAAVAAASSAPATSSSTVLSTSLHSSSSSSQQHHQSNSSTATNLSKNAYPEVTLHPVMNSTPIGATSSAELNHSGGSNANVTNQSQQNNSHSSSTNSLLHGILTKSTSRPNSSGFTSFSPTLARLLTAPERMNTQAATVTSGALANLQASTGLNLSKSNSEITITPVGSNLQQTLLAAHQQHQLQRLREQHFMNLDDEADDSVDRLVIDEGDDHHGSASAGDRRNATDGHLHRGDSGVVITAGGRGGNGPEFHDNDVPSCQGCKKRDAQFVCAGCGNQWYCSRECQVNAWDDHSDVCSG